MHIMKEDNITQIKEGFRQVFENAFTLNIGQKEIIKMKNNGVITDRDLEIAKFLFKFRFATLEQIYSYLEVLNKNKNEEMTSTNNISNRLNKLIKYRVLNKFMLTKDLTADRIVPEALEIYCLDLGGRYLLANYSNEDTTDWYTTENMKASEVINKNLAVTNFYLSLIKTIPERVLFFTLEPQMNVGKQVVVPSFDMCLEVGGNKSYFIGEVVRTYDFPIHFRDKAFKLEKLMESNAWKKYYYDAQSPPVLFLFADSDLTALEASKLITEATNIRRFRVTTDERVKRPLYKTGAFLRYSEEKNVLQEIKATTFLP